MGRLVQAGRIFFSFLWLGCFCFGGPPAHIALFQREFVEKKRWLSAQEFGHLLALSQFLPGPSSSQLGFSIGRARGGLLGAVAAFLGFTLPSALIMFFLAQSVLKGEASEGWVSSALIGLQWFAVVVVFDAVLNMGKHYCNTLMTRQFALIMLLFTLFTGMMAVVGLLIAAILGAMLLGKPQSNSGKTFGFIKPKAKQYWQLLWLLPFALFPVLEWGQSVWTHLISGYFLSGSLVFGGGHVVLPLLQQEFAQEISTDYLVAGYALAQAMPGPLFAIAAYMGVIMIPEQAELAALVGTLMLFLPGFLLVLAAEPFWNLFAQNQRIQAAAKGINASVVGLLFAIFLNPLLSGVLGLPDISLQSMWVGVVLMVGFMALRFAKLPVLGLLALMVGASLLMAYMQG